MIRALSIALCAAFCVTACAATPPTAERVEELDADVQPSLLRLQLGADKQALHHSLLHSRRTPRCERRPAAGKSRQHRELCKLISSPDRPWMMRMGNLPIAGVSWLFIDGELHGVRVKLRCEGLSKSEAMAGFKRLIQIAKTRYGAQPTLRDGQAVWRWPNARYMLSPSNCRAELSRP